VQRSPHADGRRPGTAGGGSLCAVAFYSGDDGGLEIVYIAFGATMAIFLGLTLFTLQTRIDFSGAAP